MNGNELAAIIKTKNERNHLEHTLENFPFVSFVRFCLIHLDCIVSQNLWILTPNWENFGFKNSMHTGWAPAVVGRTDKTYLKMYVAY